MSDINIPGGSQPGKRPRARKVADPETPSLTPEMQAELEALNSQAEATPSNSTLVPVDKKTVDTVAAANLAAALLRDGGANATITRPDSHSPSPANKTDTEVVELLTVPGAGILAAASSGKPSIQKLPEGKGNPFVPRVSATAEGVVPPVNSMSTPVGGRLNSAAIDAYKRGMAKHGTILDHTTGAEKMGTGKKLRAAGPSSSIYLRISPSAPLFAQEPAEPLHLSAGLHLVAGEATAGKSVVASTLACSLSHVNAVTSATYISLFEARSPRLARTAAIEVVGDSLTADGEPGTQSKTIQEPLFANPAEFLTDVKASIVQGPLSHIRGELRETLARRGMPVVVLDSIGIAIKSAYGTKRAGQAAGSLGLVPADFEFVAALNYLFSSLGIIAVAVVSSDLIERASAFEASCEGIFELGAQLGDFKHTQRVTRKSIEFSLSGVALSEGLMLQGYIEDASEYRENRYRFTEAAEAYRKAISTVGQSHTASYQSVRH